MNEEAYLAALEFAKAAIDRKDVKRMKYWLGVVEERRKVFGVWKGGPLLPHLDNDYRERAVRLLVKECR